jgi:hypothetical protein
MLWANGIGATEPALLGHRNKSGNEFGPRSEWYERALVIPGAQLLNIGGVDWTVLVLRQCVLGCATGPYSMLVRMVLIASILGSKSLDQFMQARWAFYCLN